MPVKNIAITLASTCASLLWVVFWLAIALLSTAKMNEVFIPIFIAFSSFILAIAMTKLFVTLVLANTSDFIGS